MNTTLKLTKVMAKMFVRNQQSLRFGLIMPLLIMVIFGLIGFDKPPQIDVGLVSSNPQNQTKQFVDQIKGISLFKIQEGTLEAELKDLRDGDLAVVLNIPDDFIATSAPDEPKKLDVYINEGQASQAQAVVSILSTYLDKTTLAIVNAPSYFSINQQSVNSNNLKYIDFLLPGLIAMSVMQMAVFSVAFVFVQYKEKGVLKRLLATPMQPWQFVTANVVTRLAMSVVQTGIFIAVGVWLLKAHVVGSYFLVLLCVVLGSLMFLGLGFTISAFAKTIDTVPSVANLIVFPMLFLSGTFFPISTMPVWLQYVSKALPLTYFSAAIRDVMTKNAGIGDIAGNLLAMAAWAVVLITIATISFSFQEKESA